MTKTKTCQNCKNKFVIGPEDFEFYRKINMPEPTFCPECRLQRRLTFRNERQLYKRKCDFSNKNIFSMYSPKILLKVYDRDIWWSDQWDPIEYGRDYDFNKPFFKQFDELGREIPWPSRPARNLINSDYCMNAGDLKDCYLIFNSGSSENCAYGIEIDNSKDSYDSAHLEKCELCYEGFMFTNCYRSFFSSHCDDCQEVIFCKSCVGCSNCLGCTNLKYKKYHIFNKPYSKQEYFKKLKELNIGSFKNKEQLLVKAKQEHLKYPVKYMLGRKNVNVTGEYIYNSKNVKDSYMVRNGENLRFCYSVRFNPSAKDCYDYSIPGRNARLVYEGNVVGINVNRANFCYNCYPDCRNIEYCMECHSCSDCFGCIGLRHKQYCILNKQYTKDEYSEIVEKIKKHMNDMSYTDKQENIYKYGEFFPVDISPFGYNETKANEYFPLTKEQALKQGYNWYDKPKAEYKPTIKAANLPDYIKDVDNSILKEVIECQAGTVPDSCQGSGVFRIIPQELKFYQKQNIPLPRLCPDCRHQERIKQGNPMKLWKRQCQCAGYRNDSKVYQNVQEHPHHKNRPCPNTFQTTYAPDRKEIVYCEKCYQKEVE